MRPGDSLGRRIVAAFLLFGFISSLLFAAIAIVAVEGIEVHLVDNRLAEVAAWASPRQAAGFDVDLPAGLRFHRGDDIPLSLRGLPPGVKEIQVDGAGLHVLTGADAAGPYVVVDHESDYEKVELLVFSMFGIGILGFLAFAAVLGTFVARRVVSPIQALAQAVEEGGQALPLTERKDELGVLSRALQAHTAEMRRVLDRERFFTGDVSHELRSPLTVIMGAAEILMDPAHPEPVRAPAERIYRAAREAAESVTVMLLLARAPQRDALAPVRVDEIARAEIERYRPLLAGKPVNLAFDDGPAFSVAAPPELCAAAIGNLVRNACQYTDSGSIVVAVGSRRIVVEDTGPGLPLAVREAIGHAASVVPSVGSAGTGLGLALARRICDYLGASLRYQERAEGGSRFTIDFAPDFTKP